MKIVGLVIGVIMLVLGVLSKTAVFTVSVGSESAVYQSDASEPFEKRVEIAKIPAGTSVEILKCIDTKSDQYMKVLTPNNGVGYLYNLNVVASVSLTRSPKLGPKDTLSCGLFLLGKLA